MFVVLKSGDVDDKILDGWVVEQKKIGGGQGGGGD